MLEGLELAVDAKKAGRTVDAAINLKRFQQAADAKKAAAVPGGGRKLLEITQRVQESVREEMKKAGAPLTLWAEHSFERWYAAAAAAAAVSCLSCVGCQVRRPALSQA